MVVEDSDAVWVEDTHVFLVCFGFSPLGSLSDIGFFFLWLILFPSSHSRIALHAALLFIPANRAIFSASLDM
jgi:hypothetical protein